MAQFSIAAVFSDNMVLQRGKNISIFGSSESGKSISCSLFNENDWLLSKNTTVSENGKWIIQLEPQKAQNGCKLVVKTDDEEKTFRNIAIGEVWLAGGQSNMEFELQNCTEAGEVMNLTGENAPNVRFYYTNKIAWKDEHYYEAEKNTSWQTWESEGRKAWSAVGFFFAQKLAKDLGCTVGVIGCNWGGTSASAWMRKEYLEVDDELRTYLTEQEDATRGKTVEEQLKEYDDYEVEMAKWQAGFDKLWAKDHNITWESACEILGPNPWPGPRSCKNPYRPCGLYDCMLSRIIPYTIKGVIWYQGESDDHKPQMYYKLFSRMIQNWRDDWNDDRLPFVFVQLPNHRYQADKDFKHWCLIREAQEKVHNTVKNAWMTCALDLGQFSDIHPRAKREVAQRMEACAIESVYGKETVFVPDTQINGGSAYSPLLKSTLIQGGRMVLSFENAEGGFELRSDETRYAEYCRMEENQGTPVPKEYTGFEVAACDGVYYPAKFEFGTTADTLNQIILSSPKVPSPKYARYAWRNYGPVTVYNKLGLPLAPFRTTTTDTSATTEHAAIQQIMTV